MLRRYVFAAATGAALFVLLPGPSIAAQSGLTVLARSDMYGDYQGKGGFKGKGGLMGKKGGFKGNGGFQGGGHKGGMSAGAGAAAEHSVPYNCHRICSGYLSRTRCDGSTRSPRYPVHHGVDIHIRQGTPLLAIASGEVVSSEVGDSIGGINLVIRHPPGTIRPNEYVFAMYKHLRTTSPLAAGTHVKRGERVGTSGNSGTADMYFGPGGFSHLHFETYISHSAKWPGGKLTSPVGILNGQGWPIACQ